MAFDVVGKRTVRKDAVAKVTGRAKYADDFFERDMLVGKVLRSPYAHAIVKNIDTSAAKALPGVEAVITHEVEVRYSGSSLVLRPEPQRCGRPVDAYG